MAIVAFKKPVVMSPCQFYSGFGRSVFRQDILYTLSI